MPKYSETPRLGTRQSKIADPCPADEMLRTLLYCDTQMQVHDIH